MGKRKPDPDGVSLAFEQLREQAGELTERAVHLWALQAGMTVDEWAQHWQPVVELEARPTGMVGRPERLVITVRAQAREGAPTHGREEIP